MVPDKSLDRAAARQVLFTAEMRRRLPRDCGVVAAAVHPGEVMTDVVRTLPGLMQSAYRFFMRPFCLSPAEGEALLRNSLQSTSDENNPVTTVQCCTAKGRYDQLCASRAAVGMLHHLLGLA